MNKELKNLYEQKADKLEAMKQISEKIKSGADLSTSEKMRFDNLESEVEKITSKIDVLQRSESAEAQAAVAKLQGQTGNGEDNSFQNAVRKGEFFSDGETEVPVFHRSSTRTAEQFIRKNYDNKNLDGVSFGQIVKAYLTGPKNSRMERALSEGTNSAGGFTVPDLISANIVDRLRPRSHVFSLGANLVLVEDKTKQMSMAKLTGGLTLEWLAENAASTDADPTFGQVLWKFKTLRALVKVSRELLEDSLNIEQAIEHEVVNGFATEMDKVSLLGSGTGATPKGIDNFTNVNSYSMGTNGAAIANYSPVAEAIKLMHDDNAADPTGAIMAPRTFATFTKLLDTSNQPMQRPFTIAELPFRQTSTIGIADTQGTANNASKIFLGDFTQLYWAVRTGITIIPLNQRYAENNQVAFLCVMRADLAPYNEESFAKVIGVIP